MNQVQTKVWFAYAGWMQRNADDCCVYSISDLTLVPYDSYESALWGLREEAAAFWSDNSTLPTPDFTVLSANEIFETLEPLGNDSEDFALVEICSFDIINRTGTGWRALDLKAKDDALAADTLAREYPS